jgi:hypothetical protein
MSTAAKTTRRRGVAVEAPTASKITPEMKRLVVEFHTNNKAANAAAAKAEKAREALYKLMKDSGVEEFQTETTTEAGMLVLNSKLKTLTRKVIDVVELSKLVSTEMFIQIVSATQKAVTDKAGTDIAVRCSKDVQGTENVEIKAAK